MNRRSILSWVMCLAAIWMLMVSVRADSDKEIVAVHNFNVSPSLKKLGISGWWISEKMENELVQTGKFRIVTRARIARVLREKNISAGPTLKPQALGKIIGAQYIVTGQASFSGNKLILTANIIDASRTAGEITESYDSSIFSTDKEVQAKLAELAEILAKKLTMTSGEFLDYGLKMMKLGDYEKAVQAFKDLGREIKRYKVSELTEMVIQKQLQQQAMAIGITGKTPGELLDYGIELARSGNNEKAALVFYRLQTSKMARRIHNLMKVAREGARNKEAKINKLIKAARRKYQNAIISRDEKERKQDPGALCDEAISALRAFLSNPGMYLSANEKSQIKDLIGEMEEFRKQLFAGPSGSRQWSVPGLKLELVPIKPGSFKMRNDLPAEDREEPEYVVKLTRPFWIGKYEVTAGQFQFYLKSLKLLNRKERYAVNREIKFRSRYCPLTASYGIKRGFKREHPMTCVSWRGARRFCEWLTRRESEAGRLPDGYEYRLPTEAEWEYCCRAGSDKAFAFGDDTRKLDAHAWYRSNSTSKPEPCGRKKPNAWGIHDMHGNVWEWCNDWYSKVFLVADVEDPLGPDNSSENGKVLRGGSYASSPLDLRCGSRYFYNYKNGKKNAGFRVVCGPAL